MKLPVQARPLLIPKELHRYWHDYGRCKICCQEIRHELHLYNHYRKYHWRKSIRFFVWYSDSIQNRQWVEVDLLQYVTAKTPLFRRPTAVVKGY